MLLRLLAQLALAAFVRAVLPRSELPICIECDDPRPTGSELRCGRCRLEHALRSIGPQSRAEA